MVHQQQTWMQHCWVQMVLQFGNKKNMLGKNDCLIAISAEFTHRQTRHALASATKKIKNVNCLGKSYEVEKLYSAMSEIAQKV